MEMASGAELRGLAEVPFVVAGDVVACVEGVHRAIAGRAFGAVGPMALPARLLHDGIAGGTYRGLREAARVAGRGAGLAARLLPPGTRDPSDRRAGQLLAALNGIAGDRLAARASDAAISMSVRLGGADVAAEPSALAAAFPDAGGRLAVFVHGLCGSEHSWDSRGGPDSVDYGARLEVDLGHTPVRLRYNSGRHVSENGRDLARLLEDLLAAWPAPVREIALIGHSMGGLVARSACHYGDASGARWTPAVRHVVCLGTPHQGAPLEKAANVLAHCLGALPETRPFAQLVNRRSAGIKDLRFGSVVDEDWMGRDVDAFLEDACREIPVLDTAAYTFIGATVTTDPEHPLGHLLGDLLVRLPSASGRAGRRSMTFESGDRHHVGGLHHLDLLHSPAVYEQIRRRLQAPS
jgi:pimeloyl-ACP methyl ester carboxylesterase